ncbi:hypothetical protein KR018_012527 [Drosophila ironensis]|nr:hypothetical protein KR018_012527 [Drosophila ironensis]
MRIFIIFAGVAFVIMSFATGRPAGGVGASNLTKSGDFESHPHVVKPCPSWPIWGGIGPVILPTVATEGYS